jgi:XTP/dITP diphosphohydrolase
MSALLVATNNKGKLREIKALLAGVDVELIIPSDIGIGMDVEESGDSYEENAVLKARAFAQESRLLTLADDSGLEVAALDGQPGIRSARFAPQPHATDADRRAYLLQRLEGKARPWQAQFRSVVALAQPSGEVHTAAGLCPGEIIPEERGSNGFGYDPIFLLPELQKTMAELSMEEKNRLSHRARAVHSAIPALIELLRLTP